MALGCVRHLGIRNVLVTVLLLWKDTMARATLIKKASDQKLALTVSEA